MHICDFRCVQQAAAGMDLAAHYNVHFQPLYPLYCEWRACKRAETKVCLPVMHHVPLPPEPRFVCLPECIDVQLQ